MRRIRKKYQLPKRPWDKQRIEKEKELKKNYGLGKKQEIRRAEFVLRKYRGLARELTARSNKEKEKIIIEKLIKFGLLQNGATLDDILGLTVENILERRLQSIVKNKGFANTIKHSRQLITHGHVLIDGRKIMYPSYLVPKEEEDKIKVG
jgi:small subunit ribosomal protein S4